MFPSRSNKNPPLLLVLKNALHSHSFVRLPVFAIVINVIVALLLSFFYEDDAVVMEQAERMLNLVSGSSITIVTLTFSLVRCFAFSTNKQFTHHVFFSPTTDGSQCADCRRKLFSPSLGRFFEGSHLKGHDFNQCWCVCLLLHFDVLSQRGRRRGPGISSVLTNGTWSQV